MGKGVWGKHCPPLIRSFAKEYFLKTTASALPSKSRSSHLHASCGHGIGGASTKRLWAIAENGQRRQGNRHLKPVENGGLKGRSVNSRCLWRRDAKRS